MDEVDDDVEEEDEDAWTNIGDIPTAQANSATENAILSLFGRGPAAPSPHSSEKVTIVAKEKGAKQIDGLLHCLQCFSTLS